MAPVATRRTARLISPVSGGLERRTPPAASEPRDEPYGPRRLREQSLQKSAAGCARSDWWTKAAATVPVVTKTDALHVRLKTLGEHHVRLVAEHLPLARLTPLTAAKPKGPH